MKFRKLIILMLVALLVSGCGLARNAETAEEDPAAGYDYASGGRNFSVLLKDVGVQVDDVQIRAADADGIPGYAFVILTVSVVNETGEPVVPGSFELVDELTNKYTSWQTNVSFANELQGFPLTVNRGESVTGNQVFIVPTAALRANLRLRWESALHESRIEVFLGPLGRRDWRLEIMAYELESLDLPKLTGRPLQLFALAMENGVTRSVMLGQLLQQGGITKLRQLQLNEPPTLYPLPLQQGGLNYEPTSPLLLAELALQPVRTAVPFATVRDYAEAYAEGRITPEAVAERVLDAIATSDAEPRPLRAFISIKRDEVMAQARAATARIAAGEGLTIFDGVPIAIKDEVDMVPYPTTVGTSFLGRPAATMDSTVVARLREAGALLIGKANMHEIGINPNGLNVHHGTVRNPYRLDHDPGGSSSGPAAAVAAGFCPVAIGADGGGSIRIPAAHCGLVGLKATFGRISEHGAFPLTWSMGHLGPIGATVEDVALVYAAVAGPDAADPLTLRQPPLTLSGWQNVDLRGVTLGVYPDWFQHAAPQVVAANEAMLRQLTEAGATVREIEVAELDEMRIAHAVTIFSEMAVNMQPYAAQQQQMGAAVRVNLTLGQTFTAADYLQAQQIRTRALRIFDALFEEVDAIVTPTTAVTAPPIPANGLSHGWSDLSTETEVTRYIIPGNLIGIPAISFPVGYDDNGLPIGMQVMARHWQERLLLRIALAAEGVVERKRPLLFYDILEAI